MKFSEAMTLMSEGQKVKHESWGEDTYLSEGTQKCYVVSQEGKLAKFDCEGSLFTEGWFSYKEEKKEEEALECDTSKSS